MLLFDVISIGKSRSVWQMRVIFALTDELFRLLQTKNFPENFVTQGDEPHRASSSIVTALEFIIHSNLVIAKKVIARGY